MTDDQKKQVAAAVRMRILDEAEQVRRCEFWAPPEIWPAPDAPAEVPQLSWPDAVLLLKTRPTGRGLLYRIRGRLRCTIGFGKSEAEFQRLLKERGLSF
jgi:hypothetical protein